MYAIQFRNHEAQKAIGTIIGPNPCMHRMPFDCYDSECVHAVKKSGSRFFITMGHVSFNSRANNGSGYTSERAARASMARVISRVSSKR